LNDLVETKLTDKEVKEANITVDEEDIDNAIEQVKKTNFSSDEELKAALARDGMTLEGYRKNIREQLLRTKLVHQKVKSKIVITKAEINDYYQKHIDKFGGSKKYHLRTIIKKIPAFADEAQKKEIFNKMELILADLDKGGSFEESARLNSDLVAEEGGDLGMFSIDQIAPMVRQAVSDLKEKEHTSIIETDQGYQIFYLEEIIETGGKSPEDVSDEIEDILYKEKVNKKFAEWLESIKNKSYIKIIN
jgi:peptidyl-prolyl cis-trans isomerase SurA